MEIFTANQAIGRYKRALVTDIKEKPKNKKCKSQVQKIDLEKKINGLKTRRMAQWGKNNSHSSRGPQGRLSQGPHECKASSVFAHYASPTLGEFQPASYKVSPRVYFVVTPPPHLFSLVTFNGRGYASAIYGWLPISYL